MTGWLEIRRGEAPLIVSFPHTGTDIPDGIEFRLVTPALARRDTDWNVHRLHAFAAELDATTIRTRMSRTVIDVNRDSSGASLYPGRATTELVPTTTFDGDDLYKESSRKPNAAEIAQRRATWFDPYHTALAAEIARLGASHPRLVVYDAHSIRSRIPRLFPGELPVFNLGTNDGRSCDPGLRSQLTDGLQASGFTHVTDGRFKGGWITRHYGRPADGVHAVQMEIAQRGYMDEGRPGTWEPERAVALQATLRAMLETVLAWSARSG